MSIIKRPGSPYYYTRFTAPDGTAIFQSTRTADRRQAAEFEAQLKTRLWRETQLAQSQATWREAVVSWLQSTEHKDRSGVLGRLRWLDPHIQDLPLRHIDSALLHQIRDAKLATGVRPGTVNRHLAAVSSVLNHARRRGWLDTVPPMPMMPEAKGRLRWLSHEEAGQLVAWLRARPRSDHLVNMVEFSLATGLREANVTGMKWERVDLERRLAWVPLDEAKGGRNLRVPLNDLALRVLERQQGRHGVWVFVYRGKRIRKANRDGYQAALKAMGWDDVTWHTLRHTWASWHVIAGTPLQVLMELGGWKSLDMVLRYAHLAPGHLDRFAGNAVAGWKGGKGVQNP